MYDDDNCSTVDTGFKADPASPHVAFLSFAMVVFPAIIFNIIAMIIFAKNLSRSSHQASSLLLVLACTDTLACIQAVFVHGFLIYRGPTSKVYCGVVAFLQSSLPLYSAFIASLMAFDRYLALCKPFFYKSYISVHHGRQNLSFAWAFTVVICSLPYIGLGDYYLYTKTYSTNSSELVLECNVFRRSMLGLPNVFGCIYGSVGMVTVVTVVICNGSVLKAVLRMKRIVATVVSSQSQTVPPSELVFARVIGGLSAVFVICWSPYMISVILIGVGFELQPKIQLAVHIMAGFNYIANPFIYIFMRKRYRHTVIRIIQICPCHRNPIPPNSRDTRAPDARISSIPPYF